MDIVNEFIYINELLLIYGKTLTSKQQEIMESYYLYNLSISEIATNLNISKAGVSDALQVSLKHLQNLEAIVGHYAYKKRIKGFIAELKQLSKDPQITALLDKEDQDGI